MTRTLAVFLALAIAGGAVVYRFAGRRPAGTAAAPARLYQCSMHPQIVSDQPGKCPICGMHLNLVDDARRTATAEQAPPAEPRRPLFYRHPMRADVTSPTPAKDEMGMDYVPIYAEDLSTSEGAVAGRAPFTLSTERQQLIGVTRETVEARDLERTIRAVGRVAYDPELYQAIIEYREALSARARLQASRWHEAHEGADSIVHAAALRLRQRGVTEDQLRVLAPEGRDPTNLLLPGKTVWVYAQVYEYEVDLVRPGQTVTITAPAKPNATYTARVVAVDPILDPATRTARVRMLVPTPDADLRPETFVDATIQVALGHELAVPKTAVLDTGTHRLVFVVQGEGRFAPRSVELGREAGGYYEVRAGLTAGEQVVTSANFLIDSESRFRAALAAFAGAPAEGKAR
jgi:membrane fusion protein, copper/silver efflux system